MATAAQHPNCNNKTLAPETKIWSSRQLCFAVHVYDRMLFWSLTFQRCKFSAREFVSVTNHGTILWTISRSHVLWRIAYLSCLSICDFDIWLGGGLTVSDAQARLYLRTPWPYINIVFLLLSAKFRGGGLPRRHRYYEYIKFIFATYYFCVTSRGSLPGS